jgi:hypothetical protein
LTEIGATFATVPAGAITTGVDAVTVELALDVATTVGSAILLTGFGAVYVTPVLV